MSEDVARLTARIDELERQVNEQQETIERCQRLLVAFEAFDGALGVVFRDSRTSVS